MIEAVSGGIPADITVRLGEILVTAALRDAFGSAAADAVSPFLIKIPEAVDDIPGRTWEGVWIRIIRWVCQVFLAKSGGF